MSTPEEVERERAGLIELSEAARRAGAHVKSLRASQLPWFQEMLDWIRETNQSPGMQAVEQAAVAQDPTYDPRKVERVLADFIAYMAGEMAETERMIDATWLGIQESIIALDETGEVPPASTVTLLTDLPPRPGPDDDM